MSFKVTPMTPLQSRGLAAVLLILVLAGVIAVFVAPTLVLHRRYDNAIAQQRDLLERYQRLVAQKPQVEVALEEVKRHNGRRFFLKNTATNLAGAELQDLVRAGIESSGGRVTTSQNIAPKEDGDYYKISVNVQFFATTPNLQKALQALETKTPYLVIDGMTLRPMNANRNFKPAPGQEPEINAQIEVSGWAYRPNESGGAS
ncbi:MAG: type II secretion system protein M [Burkholderiales bacterium]|jgi:general secretion pathway protein M|nr:type II secretion system protein M [Burkholderiales bacterium]